jgi:uncharacterized protein DUF664
MPRKTLSSIPGFSNEIGFYLGGMEEVREQLREAVEGMSDDHIGRQAISDAHAIGALVLHIGEAEWYWMQCVVSGQVVSDQIRCTPYWDVLKDPKGFSGKNYSADFCLNEIRKIREQTHGTLAAFRIPILNASSQSNAAVRHTSGVFAGYCITLLITKLNTKVRF